MSANLAVDLGGTTLYQPSLPAAGQTGNASGQYCGLSGQAVGLSVDLLNANTFCNVYVQGSPAFSSGLIIGVQCSDTDVSGNYTDPTAGLAQFPTSFSSGGLLWINSGGTGGLLSSGGASGSYFLSGFTTIAGFQRPLRYARLLFASGSVAVLNMAAGFISQLKITGSGGGYSVSPSSGVVNV